MKKSNDLGLKVEKKRMEAMRDAIFRKLLYNPRIKKLANWFLSQPLFFRNPVYLFFLNKRINKVVGQYKKTPFALRIENTNFCNARCFMCPHSVMKRKKGVMSRKLYKKIIDEAVEVGIGFVNLHNFGEPFLDKHFIWRVKYAKQKGIGKVSTNTNAQMLTKKLARELIESGVDEIFVSLDAATQDTYKKIRIGLDFKKVTENARYLAKLRKKLKADKPVITVDFLESDLNKHETKKFINQWRGLADNICISKIHDWSSKKKGVLTSDYKNYTSFSQAPCRLPFTELLINWDGKASLCCQDIEGEMIVGDINRESLLNIWRGKKLNAIRKKHLDLAIDKLLLCQNCKLRTFWWLF